MNNVRVLVVEDEFIIAEEIASIIEDAGCSVLGPVSSVDEAMRLLTKDRPDLAIIDANLRGQSSSPLAVRLGRMDIPFCVCTGYRMDDLKSTFGEVPVVHKPIRAKALVATLAEITARKACARE